MAIILFLIVGPSVHKINTRVFRVGCKSVFDLHAARKHVAACAHL